MIVDKIGNRVIVWSNIHDLYFKVGVSLEQADPDPLIAFCRTQKHLSQFPFLLDWVLPLLLDPDQLTRGSIMSLLLFAITLVVGWVLALALILQVLSFLLLQWLSHLLIFVDLPSYLDQLQLVLLSFCDLLLLQNDVVVNLLANKVDQVLQILIGLDLLISPRQSHSSVFYIFIYLLGRQLFCVEPPVLFYFIFKLPFLGYLITVLLNPLVDLQTATVSLIGDHLNRQVDNLETRLLKNEQYLSLLVCRQCVLLSPLLHAYYLRYDVGLLFWVWVAFVPDEATLHQVLELPVV